VSVQAAKVPTKKGGSVKKAAPAKKAASPPTSFYGPDRGLVFGPGTQPPSYLVGEVRNEEREEDTAKKEAPSPLSRCGFLPA